MSWKMISNVANTILVAGMTVSIINGTPVVSLNNDYGVISFYNEDKILGINNLSYNYVNKNEYRQKSYSKVEQEAQELFGPMRDASEKEIKSVSSYFKRISKDTGVDFWDLC